MATFSQWFVAQQKSPSVKQVSWLCGSERVLVDYVLHDIIANLPHAEWSRATYWAGTDNENDIWEDLSQWPLDSDLARLVVVRDAEKLKQTQNIIEWVSSRTQNPLTYVVFVSNDAELAREEQTKAQQKERKKPELLPHLRAIQGRGVLVECRPFTQATAKHAVTWVQSRVEIRKGVAAKLLERANGDMRLVESTLRKLSSFPEEITDQSVALLMSAQPRMSFPDALLSLDKQTALLALDRMQPSEYSSAIGLLDQRMEVLGLVREMVLAHKNIWEISNALGPMGFLAKEFIAISKAYDQKRRDSARLLLEKTDAALKAGQTVGPMEALVLLW